MRTRPFALLAALAAAAPAALPAQRLPVELGARVGVVTPDGDYSSECGHVNPALGVHARTRGATFVSASVTGYLSGTGSDVSCTASRQGQGIYVHRMGGLDLTDAIRMGVGVGHRADLGSLSVEAEATTGATRGRPGFVFETDDGPRDARWLPFVGVGFGATVFRHVTIGWEQAWTRLPFRAETHVWFPVNATDTPPAPGTGDFEVNRRPSWAPMDEVRIGIRL